MYDKIPGGIIRKVDIPKILTPIEKKKKLFSENIVKKKNQTYCIDVSSYILP